ncbi:NIPSNAP family protein [Novipirellula artificiosorum]|uniref:NIPSNAP domain-containing protein n=1 Tax=Novipirellula artificiosorum TaxID=2528016 RepID=A0A5C6D2A5_9BACT|nr:NIPSNAP family protein [Novipirellula artificiosorum]TWU30868.1 hypothetical protein Poly41_65620 [Novipirellula artificiosorum]
MKRREFFVSGGAVGLATLGNSSLVHSAGGSPTDRECYELRHYLVDSEEQRKGLDQFLAEAALPALNRLGISPVGVFTPLEGISPVTVLIPHPNTESVATLVQRMGDDRQFMTAASEFLNAPAEQPAFARMESSLMIAFRGMPKLETPITSKDRIVQLRIYESPSIVTGQKKIEMFNDAGEIAVFRKTGLHPVFFGETIVGPKMPNLTYMLAFDSQEQLKANWKQFVSSEEWQALKKLDEYADKRILSGITNTILKPTTYSQI